MINNLKERAGLESNKKAENAFHKLQNLITALNKKEIPADQADQINEEVRVVNESTATGKALTKTINKAYRSILKRAVDQLKLAPKNYYRNLWLAVGMTAFGIPFGVIFSVALDSFAFLAIGLPIGLAIGIAIGDNLDKKAAEENRQLDLSV